MGQRIADRATSFTAVTRIAEIDPKTLRALLSGARWPTAGVRSRIEAALDWPAGEIMRRAEAPYTTSSFLGAYTTTELLAELLHRATELDQRERMSVTARPGITTGQQGTFHRPPQEASGS